MKDGFIRHVGQQMLNIYIEEQPQMRKQVQNHLKGKMQGIHLGEEQFVQNRPRICNSLNVSRLEPFFVRLNSTPQMVQMNIV